MTKTDYTVEPETHERWRQSALGSITETRELEVVFHIVGELTGRRLLDVGCGDGTYAIEAARRGAVATGVDTSKAMILAAPRRAADHGVDVDLLLGDTQALPFEDEAFDVAIAITVLCLIPHPSDAVEEMARVLTPGRRLIIGELGRWSTWAAWRRFRGWFGSAAWRHTKFRSARHLCNLIRRVGLQPERVQGAVYYPPVTRIARALAPPDRIPAAITTAGAAFLAATATKPG
jgi:ubiquinone/menaquinone biosynthesis C-methylase UbiE